MDKTNLNSRRPGTIVSGSFEPIAGDPNEGQSGRGVANYTLESQIPATIRAYSRTGEYTIAETISLRDPTADLPEIAPFEPLRVRLAEPNDNALQEVVLSALRRMETCESPQRFVIQREDGDSYWIVAAQGKISPTVYQRPLDLEGETDADVIRTSTIAYIWTLLTCAANTEQELTVEDLDASDPAYLPDERWLHPVEFSYHQTATLTPELLSLVHTLREQMAGGRSSIILLRRARDLHPLLRVHNIIGAEALTMRSLEAMVRFGETMSRQLAVMSSAAVPGANRWFGSTETTGMSVISVRDLTVVGAFSLDRLGRLLAHADRLEESLQNYEPND